MSAGGHDVLGLQHLGLGLLLASRGRRIETGTMSTRDNRFTPEAHRSGFEARQVRADQKAAELAPAIAALRAAGVTSLRGIARALNDRGISPPRGHGQATQVRRLLARLPA
jgi:hypothetical protein